MRYLFFVFFMFLFTNISIAQDWPYSLYPFNLQTINPAFAGIGSGHTFNTQFFEDYEIEEFPVSYVLISGECRFSGIKSGLGIIFESHNFYAHKNTSIKLQYNYQYELQNNQTFSFGFSLNHLTKSVDYSLFQSTNPNDPLIYSGPVSDSNLDLDLGISYSKGNFISGIGINNLLKSKAGSNFLTDIFRDARNIQLINVFASYELKATEYLTYTPSLYFLSSENSDFQLDLNSSLKWVNFIITGFNYRITKEENQYSVYGGIEWEEKVQFIISMNHYPKGNWKNIALSLNVLIPNR